MRVHIGPYTKYNKKTKKTPPRKIKIKIDRWDVWSLDHTLALIILPALKALKKKKTGCPFVDEKDVPKHLRISAAKDKGDMRNGKTDSNFEKRWEWILDEMIWTFEQYHTDWERKYHTGKIDIKWVETEDSKDLPEDQKLYTLEKGPKDTHKFDKKGYTKHNERITNGLLLFGKYYRALWD